jgi:hypothetical protein
VATVLLGMLGSDLHMEIQIFIPDDTKLPFSDVP